MRNRIARMLLGLAVVLGGCTAYPVYDPYYDEGPRVVVAPPPAPYEFSGFPPAAGYLWIGGYWAWGGANYVWVPGRWEAPRQGFYWIPPRWEKDRDHWRQHGGRWEPDKHRPARPSHIPNAEQRDEPRRPAPVPPAFRPPPGREPTSERPHYPNSPRFPGSSEHGGKQAPGVSSRPRDEQKPAARQEAVPHPKPGEGADKQLDRGKSRQDPDEKSRNKRRENEKDR